MSLVFNGRSWVQTDSTPTKTPSGATGYSILPKSPKSTVYTLLNGSIAAPYTGLEADFIADENTQVTKSVQASVVGTGAVTATVIIEASNDAVSSNWLPIHTFTLSGSDSVADGFLFTQPWKYIRARLTAISGTGAAVSASIGV